MLRVAGRKSRTSRGASLACVGRIWQAPSSYSALLLLSTVHNASYAACRTHSSHAPHIKGASFPAERALHSSQPTCRAATQHLATMEGVSAELAVLLMFLVASVLVAVGLTLRRGLNIRAVVRLRQRSCAGSPAETDARHASSGSPPCFVVAGPWSCGGHARSPHGRAKGWRARGRRRLPDQP